MGFGTKELFALCRLSQPISNTQHCKPKQLHLMTCAAVFDWSEQHEGLEYSKQLRKYIMGVPPAALRLLGCIVVVMHILLYL